VKPSQESPLTQSLREALRPGQRVVIFGSTVEGEEALLLPCFRAVLTEFSGALVVVAPRHPERFDAVAELLRRSDFPVIRRSQWQGGSSEGILLLDSIGELASLYAIADVVFVGGSLVPAGGHNILEPAQFAKPVLVGQHTENFRDIVSTFVARDAVRVVNRDNITEVLSGLLRNPSEAAQLGSRGYEVVQTGAGSTERTLAELRQLLRPSATALSGGTQ
jgi:3-deoxy-D-manno-octulosonic-acid transferase